MEYTIEWVGDVFLGVSSDAGRHIGMSLLNGHPVPDEFKEGDRVRITDAPSIPYETYQPGAETQNRAYFTVTHILTGKTLTVWHETNGWRLEA